MITMPENMNATLIRCDYDNPHLYCTLKKYVHNEAKYQYVFNPSVNRWYVRVIMPRELINKIYTETKCSNEQFWKTIEILLISHMYDSNFHASIEPNSIQYSRNPYPPYGKKPTRFGVITGARLDAEFNSEYL